MHWQSRFSGNTSFIFWTVLIFGICFSIPVSFCHILMMYADLSCCVYVFSYSITNIIYNKWYRTLKVHALQKWVFNKNFVSLFIEDGCNCANANILKCDIIPSKEAFMGRKVWLKKYNFQLSTPCTNINIFKCASIIKPRFPMDI